MKRQFIVELELGATFQTGTHTKTVLVEQADSYLDAICQATYGWDDTEIESIKVRPVDLIVGQAKSKELTMQQHVERLTL